MTDDIKNLEEFLRPHLGKDKKIVDTKISRLTAPGENFGSVMLKVDVTVKNGVNTEVLHVVAKKIPATEIFREIFNIQVTYRNEIAFYDTIIPTLQQFQIENGVKNVLDCFAKFYGSRLNLDNNSNIVDENALLLMENLVAAGFANIDRIAGFDLDGTKMLVKDLAALHAVPLALKLKKPDVFEKNVKSSCTLYDVRGDFTKFHEVLLEILTDNPDTRPLVPKITMWGAKPIPPPREPFATLNHCDAWTNNTLQKFENGKMVANKFVDFQIYAYRSPASDLFFFLWSSVPVYVLEAHLDYLLQYYHKHFIRNLKELGCDISPFGYEKLLEEIKIEAEFELGHALQFSTFVVMGKKGNSQIDENFAHDKDKIRRNVSQAAKDKAVFTVLECNRRGWIHWSPYSAKM